MNDEIKGYGERYLGIRDPDEMRRVLEKASIGILPAIRTKVSKIGTSAGFIIPRRFLEMLGFQIGDKVYISITKRK